MSNPSVHPRVRSPVTLLMLLFQGLTAAPSVATEQAFDPLSTLISSAGVSSFVFADLDMDGDEDIALTGGLTPGRAEWHENRLGEPSADFGPSAVLDAALGWPARIIAADLDNDGDPDLAIVCYDDDRLGWFENRLREPSADFSPLITINSADPDGAGPLQGDINGPRSLVATDVDLDADLDLVVISESDGSLRWFRNRLREPSADFAPAATLDSGISRLTDLIRTDLDRDGDDDLLASAADTGLLQYLNADRNGGFSGATAVSAPTAGVIRIMAGDIDKDGDDDLLASNAFDRSIEWRANRLREPSNDFGPPVMVAASGVTTATAEFATALALRDADLDGDADVMFGSGESGSFVALDNTDAAGAFGAETLLAGMISAPRQAGFADVDGDGDMDVICAGANGIFWRRNITPHGWFRNPGQNIISDEAMKAESVHAADLDGDGDIDVMSASADDNRIAWYENLDGKGTFGPQITLTTSAGSARCVWSADLDNDGDRDVLSASIFDNKVAWYENLDGKGTFGPQIVISDVPMGSRFLRTGDLDGDGDQDVVVGSRRDDSVQWFENLDGAGTFGPRIVITTMAAQERSLVLTDVDADGDLDIVSASTLDNKLAWYENTDGLGTFGPQIVISTASSGPVSVNAADINGDGRLDLTLGSALDHTVAWFENLNNDGTYGPRRVVSTIAAGCRYVQPADLNNDGDIDLVSASLNDFKIACYENMDGAGTFGPQEILTREVFGAIWTDIADIDGDGDLDVLSASEGMNRIAWYENRWGHYEVEAFETAPSSMAELSRAALFRLVFRHRGVAADPPIRLLDLGVRFDDGATTPSPLTPAQTSALFSVVEVFRDSGNGLFNPGSDILISTLGTFNPEPDGSMVVPVAGGANPVVQVSPGQSVTLFLAATIRAGASGAVPNTFRATHLGSELLRAEAPSIPMILRPRFSPDVPTVPPVTIP